MLILIYLFVLDDSLTSYRSTRTEELAKCYEQLQKLRMRLWPCKIDLSPPVTVLLIVPSRYFCGGSFCFMSWCLKFLCCWRLMCVFIFLVKLR